MKCRNYCSTDPLCFHSNYFAYDEKIAMHLPLTFNKCYAHGDMVIKNNLKSAYLVKNIAITRINRGKLWPCSLSVADIVEYYSMLTINKRFNLLKMTEHVGR